MEGLAMQVDLTGGYHDAGDSVKFGAIWGSKFNIVSCLILTPIKSTCIARPFITCHHIKFGFPMAFTTTMAFEQVKPMR
ncbi:hypothetical protein SUGI_0994220 [Cryptomeria japonica]|nr:hypothetical protein SUGI_0994220 [Cryptomeria japonica]